MGNKGSSSPSRDVEDRDWHTILKSLRNSTEISARERRQAVDVFVRRAPKCGKDKSGKQWWYHDIIPYCNSDQLDMALTRAPTEKWWYSLLHLLNEDTACCAEKRSDAVDVFVCNAPRLGFSTVIVWRYYDIIPHCNSEQLETALKRALKEGWWDTVGKALERRISDPLHRDVVEEAIKRANNEDFESYILPHCKDSQLDAVLTNLLTRGQWTSVNKVLERGISDTQHRYAFEGASKRVGDQLDAVLDHLVTRGLWALVGTALKQREITLSYLSKDKLEDVLQNILSLGHWRLLSRVLASLNETQHREVVEEASKRAFDRDLEYIMPYCNDDQLDEVLTHIVTRGLWTLVQKILNEGGSKRVRTIEIATVTADELSMIEKILPHCSQEEKARIILPRLVSKRKWGLVQKMICDKIVSAVCHWTKGMQEDVKAKYDETDEDFWLIMKHCHVEVSLVHELSAALRLNIPNYTTTNFTDCFPCSTEQDNEAMFQSVLFILCCVMYGGLTVDLRCIRDKLVSEIYQIFFADMRHLTVKKMMPAADLLSQEKNMLITLTVRPYPLELPSAVKNMVLQHLLRHQKWDFISQVTSLFGVWEQGRRDLIQQSVEQRQWNVVEQWADHTVFDNQRWWVIQEAYKHKQWQVMLLLADHGLTETELMWVRYRLAMYADWGIVLQMFERGVDVTEVREVVESNVKARKTLRDPSKRQTLERRLKQLLAMEKQFTGILYERRNGRNKAAAESEPVETLNRREAKVRALKAAKLGKWCLVFFHFHCHLKNHCLEEALQIAVEREAFHVVIQLLRLLRMETAQRDSFFTKMFRLQQWAVCRALLDQGFSVQLCLDVLPQLMEMDQWSLVARVMEFNVDDTTRRQVMQRAMERREGSVVWRCISTMQHYCLTVQEREELFHQSFSCGIWQAIKPLVEKKDNTGIQHRDMALLAAIEQHQWDVVDYCQLYHADINMKDDQGETPPNRAAKKKDWKMIEELVVRGADPNILDKEGYSVLLRVICESLGDLIKLLITYLADIHQYSEPLSQSESCLTPLQALINHRQSEIIHHSLMWCPDQSIGVNSEGETTIHAIALSNSPEFLYHQVVRGVDPLMLAKDGQSVLTYAVQNSHCPQRMVAECIRLGFSTHQPQLTGGMVRDSIEVIMKDVIQGNSQQLAEYIRSPLLFSVLKGLPVIAHMLQESGSSSNTEVHHMYCHLLALTNPETDDGRKLREKCGRAWGKEYKRLIENVEAFLPYLKKMVTTPRSLKSSCHLVISHRLNVHRRYHRDVQQLPVLDDEMRKYLMFSDLTDPDYTYVTTPRSLASSCRLAIFARLFFCSRGLKAGEGRNSVPCSLDNILDSVLKAREQKTSILH